MSRDTRELCRELRHLRPLQRVSPGHQARAGRLLDQPGFARPGLGHNTGHSDRELRITTSLVRPGRAVHPGLLDQAAKGLGDGWSRSLVACW